MEEKNVRALRYLGHVGVATAFAGTLLLSAQAPLSAHTIQAKGMPTIRMGYLANNAKWVPTMDPAEITDTASSDVAHMINANLVQLEPNAALKPQLAKSWTISKSKKVYTFHLKNAHFSNGDKVTAQDVVFSIRRALSKKAASPVNYYDALLQGYNNYVAGKSGYLGVKALNASTVQMKLSAPAVYFLFALTYDVNDVLDPRVVRGTPVGTGGPYLTTTCKANVGAGPFKPVCVNNKTNDVTSFYKAGTSPTLTLVPNSHFYGKKAHVRVVLPAIDSYDTSYREFQAGGIQETTLPTTDIKGWKGKKAYFHYPSSGIEYLAPNEKARPFNNVHCRLAVAYAINRKALAGKVLNGAYTPLYDVLPPHFLGHLNGHPGVPYYNPTKAKAELKQCPGGINVTMVYRHDTTDHEAEASALQGMMADVGIKFQLKGDTRADWLKVVSAPLQSTHTAITYDDWFMDYPDPQDYCDILLHSHSTYNIQGFDDPAYDRLIDRARTDSNVASRGRLYATAQKIVLNNGAFIGMTNYGNFTLVSPHVHGFVGSFSLGDVYPKNNDWSKVYVK
ncbi:MAG: ABC transporter substrate-binding protein [Chloroflexota bacterium]